MSDIEIQVALLEKQVAALSQRMAIVEEQQRSSPSALMEPRSPRDIDAALLMRERSGSQYAEETLQGAVMYAGFAQFAEGNHLLQLEYPLPALFKQDLTRVAQTFAALAHPHRLFILRALCQEPRTSQQLQEMLNMTSPGPLYHHLKELQMAELITQQGRSVYILVPNKVVHFCVALAVATGLRTYSQVDEQQQDER